LKERISKLTGGIGIIRVGASTEAAQKEKMDRVEDAVNATKAAMEEGIVPGGGISLLMVSELITEKLGNEESWGQEIVLKALRAPARRILENAGVAEAIIKDVMDKGKLFDSKKGNYVKDMVKAGIVDPTKVERCALQNAASIASMFLTTEVGIVEEPKEEEINNKK
jgi:chaperonin GroEL